MPMPNEDITRHKPIKPQKTAIFGKTSTLNEIGCSSRSRSSRNNFSKQGSIESSASLLSTSKKINDALKNNYTKKARKKG